MPIYADTSLLASYYLPDANTQRAVTALQNAASPVLYTALHRLEMRSAMSQAVFRRIVSAADAQAAWQNIENDIKAGLLRPMKFTWYAILRQAAFLSLQYGPTTGCRSLDSLHVAAGKQAGLSDFFSFDLRQRALAQAIGLTVKP